MRRVDCVGIKKIKIILCQKRFFYSIYTCALLRVPASIYNETNFLPIRLNIIILDTYTPCDYVIK